MLNAAQRLKKFTGLFKVIPIRAIVIALCVRRLGRWNNEGFRVFNYDYRGQPSFLENPREELDDVTIHLINALVMHMYP